MAGLPKLPPDLVGELLPYLAVSGTAMLVRRDLGTIQRAAGGPVAPADHVLALIDKAREANAAVALVDERYLVGLVGPAHAIIVRLDTPGTSCLPAADRVTKACRVLARKLHGVGPLAGPGCPPTGTGSGSSGAPAHAVVFVPEGKRGGRRQPS